MRVPERARWSSRYRLGHLFGQPVLVEWDDATTVDGEWRNRDEALVEDVTGPAHIRSYGVLLGVRNGQLVLAAEENDHEDSVGSLRTIPRGCVRRVVALEEARPAPASPS